MAALAPPVDLVPRRYTSPVVATSAAPMRLERATTTAPVARSAAPVSGGYAAHLASYRNIETLERGWRILSQGNPDLLSDLTYRVGRLDQGADVFYRLKAGPLPDKVAARDLCSAFKARKLYCVVTQFNGAAPRYST